MNPDLGLIVGAIALLTAVLGLVRELLQRRNVRQGHVSPERERIRQERIRRERNRAQWALFQQQLSKLCEGGLRVDQELDPALLDGRTTPFEEATKRLPTELREYATELEAFRQDALEVHDWSETSESLSIVVMILKRRILALTIRKRRRGR
jgi:hypothetical protein